MNKDLTVTMTALLYPVKKEKLSPFILIESLGFVLTFSKVLEDVLNLTLQSTLQCNPHISSLNL